YGVILITTKSGKEGKVSVTYRNNVRIGRLVLAPTQPDSPTWARYVNEAQLNGKPNGTRSYGVIPLTIERMKAWLKKDWDNAAFNDLRTQFGADAQQYIENGQFPTSNTGYKNWTREQSFATTKLYDAYLKKASFSQQQNLSFSGGTDRVKYFSSFGFTDTDGLLRGNTNYNRRYTFHTKLNFKASDWLDIRTGINYVKLENQGPNYRGSTSGSIANYKNIFGGLTQYYAIPLKVPSGKTYSWVLGAAGILGEGGLINNERNDLTMSMGATVKLMEGLQVSADYTYRNYTSQFSKVDKEVFVEKPDGTLVRNVRSVSVSRTKKSNNIRNYQFFKMNAQYKKTFAENHHLFAQFGLQTERNSFSNLSASKDGLFAPDVSTALKTAANDNTSASDRLYSWTTLGYYGVLTYDYQQKYLIKFAARRDASSRFSPDARWGFFPSVSGAWNVAKEFFWPLKNVISTFKPRVSWSNTGDLRSGSYYSYLPTLGLGTSRSLLLGNTFAGAATPAGLVSSTLTWAKPRMIDFGVTINAFKNRLSVEYDWYQRTIKDQSGPPDPLPVTLGTNPPRLNNSESETRGWEVALAWKDQFMVAEKLFSYRVGFQMSDYIGYVTKQPENKIGKKGGTWTPGEQFGRNFVYSSGGVAQNTADLDGRTLSGTYN
ncbi:MAG: hypothetical protein ACWIPJ_09855, partial [Polaribacter sp.]